VWLPRTEGQKGVLSKKAILAYTLIPLIFKSRKDIISQQNHIHENNENIWRTILTQKPNLKSGGRIGVKRAPEEVLAALKRDLPGCSIAAGFKAKVSA
jgi:hypothetical protein